MTMDSKNLSVLAYSNGFTMWHYKTEAEKSEVEATGYFNKVANIFNVGDVLFMTVGSETKQTSMYVVNSVENDVVISSLN